MDVPVNTTKKPRHHTSDSFLSEDVRAAKGLIGYRDGFRFGVGFMLAQLTLGLVVGGIAWGLVVALHIH